MTIERYNEIVEKLNEFGKRRGWYMPHWIYMELENDGTVDGPPKGIPQEAITLLLKETGIPVDELRDWGFECQKFLEEEADRREQEEFLRGDDFNDLNDEDLED